MTLLDLWSAIQAGGTGFVLFLLAYLFFTGRLMNGAVARQARQDAEAALTKAHGEQVALMRAHFDEMQSQWRERYDEVSRDRNYYRSFAHTFAKQAGQALAVGEVAAGAVRPEEPLR